MWLRAEPLFSLAFSPSLYAAAYASLHPCLLHMLPIPHLFATHTCRTCNPHDKA